MKRDPLCNISAIATAKFEILRVTPAHISFVSTATNNGITNVINQGSLLKLSVNLCPRSAKA